MYAAALAPGILAVLALLLASGAAQAQEPGGAGLSEAEARRAVQEVWRARASALAAKLQDEDEAEAFELGGKRLRIKQMRFGRAEDGARSLWISLHGGGNALPAVNDKQWDHQVRAYRPTEGIYVAPRAPTDTWNLWHEPHVDALLERMIASYVTRHGVDPDRVYLLGYSAGGDGVFQLAPRLADRFAAAAAMAGHPNDARPEALRNLPFALFVGAEDKAFERNRVARDWEQKLRDLRLADAGGYEHLVRVYPGKGFWMDGEDREALPWMRSHRRDPWPERVVWIQDDVTHERFYWLALAEPGDAKAGARITAEVEGQTVRIVESTGYARIALRLSDELVDLSEPLRVLWGEEVVFEGRVPRTRAEIERSFAERADPGSAATARLVVEKPVD